MRVENAMKSVLGVIAALVVVFLLREASRADVRRARRCFLHKKVSVPKARTATTNRE